MPRSMVVLSVKPKYAAMIFAGTKGVELRRARPPVATGDTIMVYVTAPVKALLGTITVDRVVSGKPSALWSLVRDHAGLTRQEFDRYYAGSAVGYVIVFGSVTRLPRSVHLRVLRSLQVDFQPPQSYGYLSAKDLQSVQHLFSASSHVRRAIPT